jgi:hypothetical protein
MGYHATDDAEATARSGPLARPDRVPLHGILFVLKMGGPCEDVPRANRVPTSSCRHFQACGADSVWVRIWRARLSQPEAHDTLEWARAFLDGSVARRKRGSGFGRTKSGKACKS